jgi:hypothetical protein
MTWHYQVRKQENGDGDPWFDIVEVYTDPVGWTDDGVVPEDESYDGVIETLENMLADAKKYPVLIDKDPS